MARLPVPGGDDGTWGDILNDYLSQEHNADGTHPSHTISGAKHTGSLGSGQHGTLSDGDHSGNLSGNARVAVSKNSGSTTGTRRKINFNEGSNVTLTVADNSGAEAVDVTITAATSGGSVMVQENDSTVASAASTLDFGTGLDVTESPLGEANISIDMAELAHAHSSGTTGGQVDHVDLTNVTADQHHAQAHTLSGSDHTGALTSTQHGSLSAGDHTGDLSGNARVAISKNSGSTTGTRRRINFVEGSNVTLTVADDSGNEEVDVTIAAAAPSNSLIVQEDDTTVSSAASTLDFGTGLDVTESPAGEANISVDVAELSHAHSSGTTGGQISHIDLTGVSANQHHNQSHTLTGSDHTASGLTTGHVVRASGATTFAFAQAQHTDLGGVSADQHHAQSHGPSDHTGTAGERALVIGKAGTIPSSTANDQADYLLVVPFNVTLLRLKATAKTAPSSTTTFQIRRSTDSGVSFSNAFGTVDIASSAKLGTSDPADLDINEGDVLNFSVTSGGGTGSDVLVVIIGKVR